MNPKNDAARPGGKKQGFFRRFSGQFWLVVMFEFFERGSYYGMMSFLSVYFTDMLHIPIEKVGVIKGVIQPLLYFLPIISGAVADRFGYRKVLMVAFTLLGGGYFLTSQAGEYTAVFVALVVMGFGAGIFKPIVTGTIAKVTDESNSTMGFGIYYWSINLGAFLFPLILVPFLKSINPTYVIIASAICTAIMLIPTALFFREPVSEKKATARGQTNMIQTLAHAFEIIYSPIVLLFNHLKRTPLRRLVILVLLALFLVYAVSLYLGQPATTENFPAFGVETGDTTLIFKVKRNMQAKEDYRFTPGEGSGFPTLTVYRPQRIAEFITPLLTELQDHPALKNLTRENIETFIDRSEKKVEISLALAGSLDEDFQIEQTGPRQVKIRLNRERYPAYRDELGRALQAIPLLRGIEARDFERLFSEVNQRSFFPLFVVSLILLGMFITAVSRKPATGTPGETAANGGRIWSFTVPVFIVAVWLLPGLTTLGRIIASVIYFSILSLFMIDKEDHRKFVDHAKFLLMIFLYSGFWILYFQMFDSVLWYVQAYVDATSLNQAINAFLGLFGLHINWFFDVEHVTVINAGTIILLQLVVSSIVKKKKALPTMISGIAIGTVGMAILAISTSIWVFMAGIVLFSIGEMTAHPKFYSYIGLVAPPDRKAMYMGYVFLYGVFGSSIGGIVGAKLYAHFVYHLNQPRVLWLIFASIGGVTILCLLLYNRYLAPKKD